MTGRANSVHSALLKSLRKKPGRLNLRVTHEKGDPEAVGLRRSKLGNHVRTIRLVAEKDELVDLDAPPFLPEFPNFCRPLHCLNCLRFMDWASTNNSTEEHWSDRQQPTFCTMVATSGDPEAIYGPAPTPFQMKFSGGLAIKLVIKLSNESKIDAWFCVPHWATADYIGRFAKLVRTTLDPELKVSTEYSNEILNWQFHQVGWMLRSPLAGILVEAQGGFPWNGAAKTKGKDHPERIGALFRTESLIGRREWSSEAKKRLTRVFSIHAAWADVSVRTIKWCVDNGGVDGVSPAAHIGPSHDTYQKWATLGANLTPKSVLGDLRGKVESWKIDSGIGKFVEYGKNHGLKYVAYEGGQHIQPKGQAVLPYNAALAAVPYYPGMYELDIELLRFNRDRGYQMFGHLGSVGAQGKRWGSWGAKSNYDEPDSASPKIRALLPCNEPRQPTVSAQAEGQSNS